MLIYLICLVFVLKTVSIRLIHVLQPPIKRVMPSLVLPMVVNVWVIMVSVKQMPRLCLPVLCVPWVLDPKEVTLCILCLPKFLNLNRVQRLKQPTNMLKVACTASRVSWIIATWNQTTVVGQWLHMDQKVQLVIYERLLELSMPTKIMVLGFIQTLLIWLRVLKKLQSHGQVLDKPPVVLHLLSRLSVSLNLLVRTTWIRVPLLLGYWLARVAVILRRGHVLMM